MGTFGHWQVWQGKGTVLYSLKTQFYPVLLYQNDCLADAENPVGYKNHKCFKNLVDSGQNSTLQPSWFNFVAHTSVYVKVDSKCSPHLALKTELWVMM